MVSPCRKGWSTDPGTLGMDTSLTTSMKNGGGEGCQQNMWILIGKNKVFLTTNCGDIYIYTYNIYIYTYTLYIYMCVCGFVQEWHMGKLAISMVENDDQRLGCPRAPMFGQALGVI
jgi:hypothetical protein